MLQGGRDEDILDFDTYRVIGVDVDTVLGQGGRTYGRTDQPTRLLEFHMLFGTNKNE